MATVGPAVPQKPHPQVPGADVLLPGNVSLSGLQISGISLATVLLAIIFVIMAFLLLRPVGGSSPPLPNGITKEQLELYERWAKLNQDAAKNTVDRIVLLGQTFITGMLLPVLTAILGYIFGTKRETD